MWCGHPGNVCAAVGGAVQQAAPWWLLAALVLRRHRSGSTNLLRCAAAPMGAPGCSQVTQGRFFVQGVQ